MSDARVWAAVDRFVDRAPRVSDLLVHRLHLFAARRWRAQEREVPQRFREEEHAAAAAVASAPLILQRIGAASDGPVLLLKGPEVAARYPDATLRPFADIDVLVADRDGPPNACRLYD